MRGEQLPDAAAFRGLFRPANFRRRRFQLSMASTRQIRSRIRTAKNIEQITKAMKMVAAARLKRAQERV